MQRYDLNPDSTGAQDALIEHADGAWVKYTDAQAAIDAAVLDRTTAEANAADAADKLAQAQIQIANLNVKIQELSDTNTTIAGNCNTLNDRVLALSADAADKSQKLLDSFDNNNKLRQAAQSAVTNLNNVLAKN